jgi:hypothetical protein
MTTRRWLLVVVVVAFGFGLWNEWTYRVYRNRMARVEAKFRDIADQHERERLACEEGRRTGAAYDGALRYEEMARRKLTYDPDLYGYGLEDAGFEGWDREARYHAGHRDSFRDMQAAYAGFRRDAERHLIFP